MSLFQTLVLICLAGASATADIGVKPRKFVSFSEHQQIAVTYADRNQERQLQDLTGLWDSYIAKNGKLSHLQKTSGDKHLLSKVLVASINNAPLDNESPTEAGVIINRLRPVSDELVDCYRYYRDLTYAVSSFYRKSSHTHPVTNLEMDLQSKVSASYSMGPMKTEAERFRADLVQLCGRRAVDKLDASFAKSGMYFPKD